MTEYRDLTAMRPPSMYDLDQIEKALAAGTRGPWRWEDYRYGPPTLIGRAGDDFYAYDTEVLEAEHHGECGCRSACTLELNISVEDRNLIAALRNHADDLVAEVRRLRAAVARVEQIERWPYNPGTMQGFELDHAQGYNDALTEVNRALHPEGPDHD